MSGNVFQQTPSVPIPQNQTLNHSNLTSKSRDMRLSTYLAAILDLCKLGGFPTGVEFQQIDTCYDTSLQTYWWKNCLVTI